jgi:sulfur-carrier protein
MIRLVLPGPLHTLAHIDSEVELHIEGQATIRSVLDALEAQYPVLRGMIRDYVSHRRRPLLRFFAGKEDLSNEFPDTPLPQAVTSGAEPLIIVAAIAGG